MIKPLVVHAGLSRQLKLCQTEFVSRLVRKLKPVLQLKIYCPVVGLLVVMVVMEATQRLLGHILKILDLFLVMNSTTLYGVVHMPLHPVGIQMLVRKRHVEPWRQLLTV